MAGSRSSHGLLALVVLIGVSPVVAPAAGANGSPEVSGDLLWSVRWNGPANSYDDAFAVAASPDGSKAYVTGRSFRPSSDYDYVTFAYDAATGSQVWAARYNGPGNKFDSPDSIGVSPDGSKVFVTGYSDRTGSFGGYDFATVAYDATNGAELWVSRYNGPTNGDEFDPHLTLSPDGSRVFVTGRSEGNTAEDYATVAYDAANGVRLWARYSGPVGENDAPYALVATATGVFVTGKSPGRSGFDDYATVGYDSGTGSLLWINRYNGPGHREDVALSIAASPDGTRVFATGYSGGDGTSYDYATMAIDATSGTAIWWQRYNGAGNGKDRAVSVGVSSDGSRVFVTGTSYSVETGDDFATVAYDAVTGTGLWRRRFDGGGTTYGATGLVARTNGVFVAGSIIKNGFDFLTLAYDPATGSTMWGRRYNGPTGGRDIPYAIAATPDGSKVFVTGYSNRALANEDYATVAYEG